MLANPFKDIQVFYDGLGRTAIAWLIDERFDDPHPHYFQLHFSRSSTGFNSNEYEAIDAGTNVTFLKDEKFRTAGYAGSSYYRIVLNTPAGQYVSGVKGFSGNLDKKNLAIMREVLRKEQLALRPDRGATAGYLFKRRYYGPKCECSDPNTGTPVASGCLSCVGTGFEYAYFAGVDFPILITSAEESQVQMSDMGSLSVRSIEARCLAFPVAGSKDVWLERDTNRVYEIKKSAIVSRYSYVPVANQIELRELPLADTVSLIMSSIRDIAVTNDPIAPTSYNAPIIIAENPTIPVGDTDAIGTPGTVGLVTANNSPFAELVTNNTLLLQNTNLDTDAISNVLLNTPVPAPVISVPANTPTVIATTTPNVTQVVCDNDLDGGLY
jgi:hypothetical protein